MVASDRGLAGGFNSNLNRKVERFLVEEKPRLPRVDLVTIGRKARENFKKREGLVFASHPAPASDTIAAMAHQLAAEATAAFLAEDPNERVDAVFVAFNVFQSAIAQVPEVVQLLPVPMAPQEAAGAAQLDFEYEPNKAAVLATALPLYLEVTIRRSLLESVASFFGAQMSAMDNATKNAKEMISSLTLVFNRARQAAITKELMEIVGGAEALKG